jgi:hypothetical protein
MRVYLEIEDEDAPVLQRLARHKRWSVRDVAADLLHQKVQDEKQQLEAEPSPIAKAS